MSEARGVILIFTRFVGEMIEKLHHFAIFRFPMRSAHRARQRRPGFGHFFEFKRRPIIFPVASVVLLVGQHVADVDLISIIMHGRNQSKFVPPISRR